MKYIFLLFCFVLISNVSQASKIGRITLEEMESKAEYIILGRVIGIEQDLDRDKVTIEIRKILKGGRLTKGSVSFWLTSRGGLKDFDPELKLGYSVVAFLTKEGESFKKAYWGSVSIFTQPNYL